MDEMDISDPAQFQALGHPLRHRLLFALGIRDATISQLAAGLGTRKGNVAHHLKVLADAGMVTVARTQPVRGGTERYYRRTAGKFRYTGPASDAATAVTLRAVALEMTGAEPEPLLALRNVRLSERQAARLTADLRKLVDEVDDAGSGEPRYGVLVALYRPRS
jgi:DNA-binding transcriptional ArsR family regulator